MEFDIISNKERVHAFFFSYTNNDRCWWVCCFRDNINGAAVCPLAVSVFKCIHISLKNVWNIHSTYVHYMCVVIFDMERNVPDNKLLF